MQTELQHSISNKHFCRMVGNIPGMIYQYVRHADGSEDFPFVGYYCLELYGIEAKCIQQDVSVFWQAAHPDDLSILKASINQAIKNLQPWSLEWRILVPFGHLKWVQGFAKPTPLENGDVVLDGVLIDISDRKRLEAERDQFFNLPLDILGVADFSGRFQQVNSAVTIILGHSTEAFLAKPFIEWVHREDQELTRTEMERLANGATIGLFENRCKCQDGSYRWLFWKAVSIPEKQLIYVVGRDVTSQKQAEAALRRSHEELERRVQERTLALQKAYQELTSLMENSPLAVIEWDQDLRVQTWSPQAENLFGWSAADVIGKHPQEWKFACKTGVEQPHISVLPLVSSHQQQSACCKRNYTRNGDLIYCEWYNSILFDEAGNLLSILSLVLDITQQKQAEELLKQQLAAIENSIDGIAILDQEERYIYLNRAYTEMFGYDDAEELLNKTWREIYHPSEISRFEQEVFPLFMQRGYWRGEAIGKKQDGRPIPQEVSLTLIDHGGLTYICRDITERKQFESQLLRSWTEMETRVQERTQELNEANNYLKAEIIEREKLTLELAQSEAALRKSETKILQALEQEKELNELKSRFITNTSHEFRTPLTTILGSAELLEYSSDKWTQEKKEKHYQRIRSAVQHITQLLNDVLTFNKADAGKLTFEPTLIDAKAFFKNFVNDLESSIPTELTLQFDCKNEPILAELDEKLLRQILENLVSNAIKYSSAGGFIFFDLRCTNNTLIFQIRDQGIGIPNADLPHLFEPFHRAANVGTISGTGLGLAIVQRAVHLHEGDITIASESGQGTVCTVELPLRAEPKTVVPP